MLWERFVCEAYTAGQLRCNFFRKAGDLILQIHNALFVYVPVPVDREHAKP
jgi:hypothetical protein